jgi:hypothetical protein
MSAGTSPKVLRRKLRDALAIGGITLLLLDVALRFALPRVMHDPNFYQSVARAGANIDGLNNYLLRDPRDYPRPRDPDEYVIGVFGGSVADSFAIHAREMDEMRSSASALSRRLGKRVRIANMALGGGVEPAQFNLFHMLNDQIDAAIFLDGFNELAASGDEGLGRGCADLAEIWAAPESAPRQLPASIRARTARVRAFTRTWWTPLAYLSGLFSLYLYNESRGLSDEVNHFYRTLGRTALDAPRPELSAAERGDLWQRCIELTAAFAATRGRPIHFFLQPNQYVHGSKPFSDEEKAHAFHKPGDNDAATWDFYQALDARYRELGQRVEALRAQGLAVTSLVDVFHDRAETFYIDTCCHLNRAGEAVMGEAIFAELVADLDRPQER